VANTKSSEKRNRQNIKRRARNVAVRTGVKGLLKKAREAIATGDSAKAKEAVRVAVAELDKASSKGVLHQRNAARRASRLMHALNAKKA
jgi:small subunit ribosomal protein S20